MNLQEKHYVGVDCHKDTIACYINGKFKEFRTDFKGFSMNCTLKSGQLTNK